MFLKIQRREGGELHLKTDTESGAAVQFRMSLALKASVHSELSSLCLPLNSGRGTGSRNEFPQFIVPAED